MKSIRLPSSLIAACSASLALASLAHAQSTPTFNDVTFATAPITGGTRPLKMDIYSPTGGPAGPSPVAIFIHGGGWQGGTYDTPPGLLLPLRPLGVTVVSVDYRLSGEAIFPAQIHDVKAAIRFLRAHAADFNIDPARIATAGTSAGGHLSALVATSGNAPALEGSIGGNLGHSSAVAGAVDFFGPTDIININPDVATPPGSTLDHDSPASPESKLIGFGLTGQGMGVLRANLTNPNPPFPQKVALANAVNPITHIDAADPPMFIAHGNQDTMVPIKQSRRLRDAAADEGVEFEYAEVATAGHGSLGMTTEDAARAFLLSHLGMPVPPQCLGDINHNGFVDGADLGMLLNGWDTPLRDLNGDGTTDGGDLGILLAEWGPCGT